ncbi:hypothetical protein H0A66_07305 [Alcaligenaceae bacterium]|nr:hypothetical protein [Alcaligenaceae bacterium]
MKPLTLMRFGKAAVSALSIGMLVGCTTMADMPSGSSLQQVEAKYGQPNYSCPAQHGGQRLIWSMQPMGQYAWGTNVDSAGNTDSIQSLLTDEHFRVLATGTWTPEQVRCEFGPPAKIESVGLPSSSQTVWSYRYRQNHTWNSLMYVYFGNDGVKVTRFHPGPDPMFDGDRFWFD